MPPHSQKIHNKNHGNLKRLSGVGRKGRASLRARTRQLKSVGKLHEVLQEDKNPASVIQKVHLFEKQREFLSAQADVFERRTVTLHEEIKNLTDRITVQYKHAETVFSRGAEGSSDFNVGEDDDSGATKGKKRTKKSKPDSTSTGQNKVFSIKY
jgi:hypothetical protein